MSYEVELKFPLENPAGVLGRIAKFQPVEQDVVFQRDDYFGHPTRNFKETDEAFRLRCTGEFNRLTYKGPRIDPRTKTRREIEVAIAEGSDAAENMRQILLALGFFPVGTVAKQRQTWQLTIDDIGVEIAHDRLEQLGEFLEIEATAGEGDLESTTNMLLDFAASLGLSEQERRGYLELVLAAEAGE